jgi:hypothetical protein
MRAQEKGAESVRQKDPPSYPFSATSCAAKEALARAFKEKPSVPDARFFQRSPCRKS